jgi:hypothetical protein
MIVAEKCLTILLQRFYRECIALDGDRPLPEKLDDLTLGSVLLVSEYYDKLKHSKVLEELENCILALEFSPRDSEPYPLSMWLSYDQMLFRIAATLIQKQRLPLRTCVEELREAVVHHRSSLRWHFYRVCWMLRRHLPKEKILDPLLKSISDYLGYVYEAVGLAYTLCDDVQDFFMRADGFEPEPLFFDQYRRRINNSLRVSAFLRVP